MLNNAEGEGAKLGRTFRAHPVAIALIGVECGWLAISATGAGERLRKQASDASTHARAWAGQLREKLMAMAARPSPSRGPGPAEAGGYAYAREKSMAQAGGNAPSAGAGLHAPGPAGQAVSAAGHCTAEDADDAHSIKERFGEVLERHPLMILGLTVAAGAAISLVLPASEKKQVGGDRIEGAGGAEMLK